MPEGEGTILLYHGVSSSPSAGIENFSGKHIGVEAFQRQMECIAKKCTPMSLRDMAKLLESHLPLPPGAVAVTFDDSFKNVRTTALPVLSAHNIPATFFISTGFVANHRQFWVDQVEHCLNCCRESSLRFRIGEKEVCFPLTRREEKIAAAIRIKQHLKRVKPEERTGPLAALVRATGVTDGGHGIANYAKMDWEDVRALHQPPQFEVGGHTVNHEILSLLSPDGIEHEISSCLEMLASRIGHCVDLFSYPEGQQEHFNESVIARLKYHGVTVCPTAIAGTNKAGENPFYLKRIMVGFMGTPFPFDED